MPGGYGFEPPYARDYRVYADVHRADPPPSFNMENWSSASNALLRKGVNENFQGTPFDQFPTEKQEIPKETINMDRTYHAGNIGATKSSFSSYLASVPRKIGKTSVRTYE